MRAVIIVAVVLAAGLFVACGDDDDPGSATPTPAASATPTATAPPECAANQLYAAFVRTGVAAGSQYLEFGVSNTLGDCTISAPAINWYDESGAAIDIAHTTNGDCASADADPHTCVQTGRVLLRGGGTTPAPGVDGQVLVVVAVASIGVLEPCASPAQAAHFIGLAFNGEDLDAQAELPQDLDLQSCAPQVVLYGFGAAGSAASPSAEPSPTATAQTVAWDDVQPLFDDCRVKSVMQTHAQDVYLMLDDGTEIHTTEPGIDDVIGIAMEAQTKCGESISIGTE